MTTVMNLGVPSWGSLGRERLTDSDGSLLADFLVPTPAGDRPEDYFTLDEYAQFAWYFPSTVFFFSGSLFTFRVFSLVVKPLGYIGAIDSVIQDFVSSVHDNSLLPKSDKATKLAREIRPMRRILEDLEFSDVDSCRVILAYVLTYPTCPTQKSMEEFFNYAILAKEMGAAERLSSAVVTVVERSADSLQA